MTATASVTTLTEDQRPLPRRQFLSGDARRLLHDLPDDCIDMVLTSPPYFRLRNYDASGQIGLEAHPEAWVDDLRAIARDLARVLTPHGSLWLNLGDTYSTHARQGAARKSLLLAPERLAVELVADGWILRNKLIWAKPNPVPSSATDRLTATWEVIYVFVRSDRYYFDLDSIRAPHTMPRPQPNPHAGERWRASSGAEAWRGPNATHTSGLDYLKSIGIPGHPLGKNPGDVWTIASSNYRGGHHATFPLQLARRAITAGCPKLRCSRCRAPWKRTLVRHPLTSTAHREPSAPTCICDAVPERGLVLDPFMGAGTTALAAEELHRDWLGIEINPHYVGLSEDRLAEAHSKSQQPDHRTRGSPTAA